MASPLFFREHPPQSRPRTFPQGTFLQTPVLFFKFRYKQHHGDIHATVLGMPLVKSRSADIQLSANVGHHKTSFNPLERIHDLAVGEF